MKMKIAFKPLRNLAAKPVRIINKKARAVVKPAVRLGSVIWRGRRMHLGSWKSFREKLYARASAPFHFALPGLKAGKA
jgi:hypothetical protein